MTDSQLSHPAFLLSLGDLASSLAMRMGIDSIQHHSSLNWGPCILSLCPVFHAFCVFFLFSIAFWVLLFTSIQFCIITCVQCPVFFVVLNVNFILWETGNNSWVVHQRADSDTQSSLPALYFGNREQFFRTAESLIKNWSIMGPGEYNSENC